MRGTVTTHSHIGSNDPFARIIRESIIAGTVPGGVAAVHSPQIIRVQAFGMQDVAAQTPMRVDTLFRVGSMAKAVFAAAALVLIEDRHIDLHTDVSRWLPELADRSVLRTPRGEMDDVVPAVRAITLFDVLTFQLGLGMYLADRDTPHLRAMHQLGVAPATELLPFGPDEFMARLGTLPLAHQPGEAFMYHSGDDVLRVLIGRISGQPLDIFLQERVFAPLGMTDTALVVPETKRPRTSTCYYPRPEGQGDFPVWDTPDGRFSELPSFPNSLVSTLGDYLTFSQMIISGGSYGGRNLLSPEYCKLLTTDHLSQVQKSRSPAPEGFWQKRGWGMGATVYAQDVAGGPKAGSYSWFGGYGGHYLIDPKAGSAIVLMINRMVKSGNDTDLGYEFERDTYRDILC